jgi:hypothetical protein
MRKNKKVFTYMYEALLAQKEVKEGTFKMVLTKHPNLQPYPPPLMT